MIVALGCKLTGQPLFAEERLLCALMLQPTQVGVITWIISRC